MDKQSINKDKTEEPVSGSIKSDNRSNFDKAYDPDIATRQSFEKMMHWG